jgi:hypothetical protein
MQHPKMMYFLDMDDIGENKKNIAQYLSGNDVVAVTLDVITQ